MPAAPKRRVSRQRHIAEAQSLPAVFNFSLSLLFPAQSTPEVLCTPSISPLQCSILGCLWTPQPPSVTKKTPSLTQATPPPQHVQLLCLQAGTRFKNYVVDTCSILLLEVVDSSPPLQTRNGGNARSRHVCIMLLVLLLRLLRIVLFYSAYTTVICLIT